MSIQNPTEREQHVSCDGKFGHESKTDAVRILQRDRRSRKAGRVSAYRCEFCGKWHVGSVLQTRTIGKKH